MNVKKEFNEDDDDRQYCPAYTRVNGLTIDRGGMFSSDKLELHVGESRLKLEPIIKERILYVKQPEKYYKTSVIVGLGKTEGDKDCDHFIPINIFKMPDFELGTDATGHIFWHGTANELIQYKMLYKGPPATNKFLSVKNDGRADYYRVANTNLNLNQHDARQIRPRGAPGGGGKSKRSSVRRRQSRHRRRRTNRSTRRK